MNKNLPCAFQPGEIVQVVFPSNGILKDCKIHRVSFTEGCNNPLYDVDVPFTFSDTVSPATYLPEPDQKLSVKKGYYRLPRVREWFISYSEKDWPTVSQ